VLAASSFSREPFKTRFGYQLTIIVLEKPFLQACRLPAKFMGVLHSTYFPVPKSFPVQSSFFLRTAFLVLVASTIQAVLALFLAIVSLLA
jgi:hypothetical protein